MLIVFYSESLPSGLALTFLSSPNGRWCVVFALDLCVGGALWFTELWHCLSSGTREADCGSLCVFQVSLRSAHHLYTHIHTHAHSVGNMPWNSQMTHMDILIYILSPILWRDRAGKLLLSQNPPFRFTSSTEGQEGIFCCPAGIEDQFFKAAQMWKMSSSFCFLDLD